MPEYYYSGTRTGYMEIEIIGFVINGSVISFPLTLVNLGKKRVIAL